MRRLLCAWTLSLLGLVHVHLPAQAHGEHGCVTLYRWKAHKWVTLCTGPPARRHAPPRRGNRSYTLWLRVTYYCDSVNLTASGVRVGIGVIASNIFPFGTRLTVPDIRYSGVVLDRIGWGTQVDVWLPCGQRGFPSGMHRVIVGS